MNPQRKKELNLKKNLQKDVKEQLNMFNRIPDSCTLCNSPFDKKSKDHAQNWKIAVWNEEKIVKLFCPECQKKAEEKNEAN